MGKGVFAVRSTTPSFLLVGGGFITPEAAARISKAGADVIVIGNLLKIEGCEDNFASIVKAAR